MRVMSLSDIHSFRKRNTTATLSNTLLNTCTIVHVWVYWIPENSCKSENSTYFPLQLHLPKKEAKSLSYTICNQ